MMYLLFHYSGVNLATIKNTLKVKVTIKYPGCSQKTATVTLKLGYVFKHIENGVYNFKSNLKSFIYHKSFLCGRNVRIEALKRVSCIRLC